MGAEIPFVITPVSPAILKSFAVMSPDSSIILEILAVIALGSRGTF
jgi:hypothetical protein